MRKIAITLLTMGVAASVAMTASAAPLFTEDFGYATPSGLVGQGGWAAHSGAGTNPQTVNTPGGLSYAGYPGSGVGALLGPLATSGEDTNHSFTGQSTGAVYAAVMINVASSQTTGDYLFHFDDGLITSNIFRARMFVKKDASTTNYALGIQFGSNGPPSYTGFVYTPGTTHLCVVKYTFVAGGTANDQVSLIIDPNLASGCAEPSPNVTHSDATQTDATNLDFVCIRQGTSTSAASAQLDGVRIATTWADAVGCVVTPTNSSTWGRMKTLYR